MCESSRFDLVLEQDERDPGDDARAVTPDYRRSEVTHRASVAPGLTTGPSL